MSENLLVSATKEIDVKSKGATAGDAINDAFAQLRKIVYGQVPGPIAHMEPIGLSVGKCTVHSRTERFLGLLWPRQKREIELDLTISVSIRYIRVDGFQQREMNRSVDLRSAWLETGDQRQRQDDRAGGVGSTGGSS